MEKEYIFTVHRGSDDTKQVTVKESELTKGQEDLLLAEALKIMEDFPDKVKKRLATYLV